MKNRIIDAKEYFFGKPNLDDDNVKRLLIRLSIPAIIGIIVNNFYNIMDSIFVGRGVGAEAIGALTIAYPFQSLLVTFAMMVATGGMSILSRSLGEDNKQKASLCFGNSITLTLIVSLLLSVFGLIFLEDILTLLGGRGELLTLAKDYMSIILLGTPFMGLAYILSELLRSEGKAKESMIIMAIGAISNIVLDFIFIIVFEWGVKGAALATSLANLISFLYALVILMKGQSVLKLKKEYFVIKVQLVKEMLSVGVSSLISQGSGSIGNAIANVCIMNVGGAILISSIGVFSRIHSIIFMPIFGVIQGMQPILGYNYGAKNLKKVKEASRLTLKYVFIIALFTSTVVLLFTELWVTLFISDTEIINYAVPNIKIAILFSCIGAWQCVGGTVFRAVGMAKKAFFFAVLRMIIIFAPTIYILSRLIGPLGCWLAYAISDLLSGVISIYYINGFLNRLKFDK